MLSNLTAQNRYWLGLSADQAAPLLAVTGTFSPELAQRDLAHTLIGQLQPPPPECEPNLCLKIGGRETSDKAKSEQQLLNLGAIYSESPTTVSIMGREKKSGGLGLYDLNFQLLGNLKT